METKEHQDLYFGNIQKYLAEIGEKVGLQVGLYIRPSLIECTNPQSLNFWDYSQIHKDQHYGILDRALPTRVISTFNVVPFPGCCALCISTGARVYEPYRDRGVNILANKIRQEIAKIAGYTAMVCTDIKNNTPTRKMLERNGWQDVYEVTNRRTGRLLAMSVKSLKHGE